MCGVEVFLSYCYSFRVAWRLMWSVKIGAFSLPRLDVNFAQGWLLWGTPHEWRSKGIINPRPPDNIYTNYSSDCWAERVCQCVWRCSTITTCNCYCIAVHFWLFSPVGPSRPSLISGRSLTIACLLRGVGQRPQQPDPSRSRRRRRRWAAGNLDYKLLQHASDLRVLAPHLHPRPQSVS